MRQEKLSVSNNEHQETQKLKKLKNSNTYKKLASSVAAIMLAQWVQTTDVSANEISFENSRSEQQQYEESHQNTQIFDLFWWLVRVSMKRWDRNNRHQRWEWIDPNSGNNNIENQLDKINQTINKLINQINNTRNHRERQEYINELHQLTEIRNSIQNSNNDYNRWWYYNNYEHNNNYSTIRTSFGSNSNYWSNNPDKRKKMKELEEHQVSYRFYDSTFSREKLDKLTSLYQVDENGRRIWRFDKMLSNGESVLLKFEFGNRSEIIQVSYKDRILKIRPTNKRYSKELFINRKKVNHWKYKIAFGKWANKDWDGYRMVLRLRIEN